VYYNRRIPAAATRSSFLHENYFRALAGPPLVAMKNVYEVLREKEMDLARLRTEVDALRFVAPLLSDRSSEPTEVEHIPRPDLAWTPALERNKWPLQVGDAAPTYSDS